MRRIHKNHCAALGPQHILPVGFRPGPADTTGLSIYREHLVTAADVAAAGRSPGDYFVVRLPVAALHGLGLSVVAEADEEDGPGHAVIPELSWPAYQQTKEPLKALTVALARLANQGIVVAPT